MSDAVFRFFFINMGALYSIIITYISFSVHSHYDLSAEGIRAKHQEIVKKEAEKYAQAALKIPKVNMDVAEQIRILTETFKK